MDSQKLLEVKNLEINILFDQGELETVRDVSFDIDKGEIFGIVGESGSGKSLTALSILGLLRKPLRQSGGQILYHGEDLTVLPQNKRRKLCGSKIAMIFQEPMTALNPLMNIGDQVAEMFILHKGCDTKTAKMKAIQSLAQVHVPSPEERIKDYPHQLSGGMRQRVMIAMALACDPDLLIADEPTTALDVTIQAEIVNLILQLCQNKKTAVLIISHDLGLVAGMAQRIGVMYAGKMVEQRTSQYIFTEPVHPYTNGLVNSLPLLGSRLKHGQRNLKEIKGTVPSVQEFNNMGCAFFNRCPRALDKCLHDFPEKYYLSDQDYVRCFNHDRK